MRVRWFVRVMGCALSMAVLWSLPAAASERRPPGAREVPVGGVFARRVAAATSSPGELGGSVAISGSMAVVGAPGDNLGRGAAYVFVRSGGAWSEQAKLTVSHEEPSCVYSYSQRHGEVCTSGGEGFGGTVAIYGSTVVVGAPGRTTAHAVHRGVAYVFTRSGASWSQQAELKASDGSSYDSFGGSLSLYKSTAVVCGGRAVYVFVRSGSSWSQQAKLTGPAAAPDRGFGGPASIYGSTLVVGAPGGRHGSAYGAAYVFVRSGSAWSQQAELTAPGTGPGEEFGSSLSIYGSTIVVGAEFADFERGAAYVFSRSGTAWSEQTELTIPPGTRANHQFAFGASVAIYGSRAVVGAPWKNAKQGAAYVFARSGTSWAKRTKLTTNGNAKGDYLGSSVAIQGSRALVGAPGTPPDGAAYVFSRSDLPWTERAKLTATR